MQHINIFTKTRWLVTIILLFFLSAGQIWGNTTDNLTYSVIGLGNTNNNNDTYTTFTNKAATSSARYAGQILKFRKNSTNSFIQLKSKDSSSGIVSTTSGGDAKKVTITWNSGCTSGRVIDVYGKTTAYSSASDLYGDNTKGTKLGSITEGTSTELSITGSYQYIGIRSNSGALMVDNIAIEWGSACAAPTGLTKGSFNASQQTMPISWTSAAGTVDICYSTSSTKPGATPSASYTVISGQTSSPVNLDVSGLNASTNYYVWARSVCSANSKSDWVAMTNSYFTLPSHTLTVNKSGGDAGCGVSPTSQTVVEGRTVSISATAGAGSTFSGWSVSGTGATMNNSTSATTTNPGTFKMGTANATVTATFACITPTFGTNLTTGTVNYYQGDEASALVVAATAGTATITYQWQTKVGSGDWTNTGTNAAGNTSITPSTSSTGTIQYRCVATNSATSCSTTTESNVVTVVVSEPLCTAPTAVAKSSETNTGATLTVTDANDANKYDFYCSTSSTAPANNATPTASVSDGKAKAITGLAYGTTYYYWARTDCGDSKLSPWFPSENPSTFTTTCPTPTSISANPSKPTIATFTITDNNNPVVGAYDIYYSESSTAPDANTTPSISNTTNTSETVTTLSAGTMYYFWVRGVGANAKSAWVSGGNFTTPTLSSISVKTSPKANYLVGETFDPTGLEITLHYSNEATDDVTYAGNTGLFTFAPNTALAANDEAVRVTYGGVYVDYEVNVYSITVNKVEEDGTTAITADGVTAGCATRTLSASEGSTNYSFWKWEIAGDANGLAISNGSITGTPTGNVTIKAFLYKPVTVTWLSNRKAVAAGSQTTEVKRGTQWKNLTKPSDPSAPTSCSSKVFKGWTNMSDDWSGDTHDAAPSVCLTSFSGITTAINEPITFKAVFATSSGSGTTYVQATSVAVNDVVVIAEIDHVADNKVGKELSSFSSTSTVYGIGADYGSSQDPLPAGTMEWTVVEGYNKTGVAFKNGNNYLFWTSGNSLNVNTTLSANTSWTVETYDVPNTSDKRAKITNNNDNTRVVCWNKNSPRFACYASKDHGADASNNYYYYPVFYKKVSNVSYIDYVTECCAGLDDFNGAVEWNDPTEAVLTWDDVDNVSGWAVKYKKHADDEYTTFAGSITTNSSDKKTCTIGSLKCGTDYDFQIIATPADGYCDKSETIEDTQAHKYAITLDPANGELTGGTFIAYAESECDGEDVSIEAEAATGYEFASWTITKASSGTVSPAEEAASTTFEMPAEAVTVSADFDPIEYTITYNLDGGTNHGDNPATYTIEDADITLGAPTKDNFNFGGWFIDSDLAAGHEAGSPAIAAGSTGNKTFYAKWIADDKWSVAITAPSNGTITVSWNSGANSFSSGSQNIEKNTDITITATPAAGYQLTSLKIDDADFTSGNTHKLTASITISATFTAIEYTITYNNMDGATNHGDNVASYKITDATITLGTPTKTGYTFGGWFNNSDLAEEHKVTSIASGSTGNVVLYAKWSINSYTLSWVTDGDELTGDYTSGSVEYGTTLVEPATPTKTGYTFAGWDAEVAETMPAGNTTYTATWTINNYTVKWSVNDDEYAEGEPTTSADYNTNISKLPTAPTSNDCDDLKKFVGWRATKISGISKDEPSGILTKLADFPKITDNTTFYAVFADVTGGNEIELTFPDDNSSSNNTIQDYTSTWTAKAGTFEFSIENFNNNKWGNDWTYIKCGRKNNASVGSITTGSDIDFPVDSVLITIDAITTGNVNSAKLQISSVSTFATKTEMDIPKSTGTKRLEISSPATEQYYRIVYDCSSASSNGVVTISKIIFKQKLDTVNFVTKCASCDDPATFTTATPAVSEIACTSATVTATGGLATLGSEGCNISDYGFVIGTSENPALNEDGTAPSGVTKLQVGTSNPTLAADFSYDITGLTKGTQYNVRAYAINKNSIAYSSNKSFYTKGVSSIAITTAPTKTNYIVGETFDAAGMEVTATLAGGATDDVTTDVTYSTSALTAGVDQNFTISYTLCETEKTATQMINVYSVTVDEGENDENGEMSYDNAGTITVSNLAEHTTVSLDVENATIQDNGNGTFSIINPTGNVTVTVNYIEAVQVAVKYYVNGNELTGLAKNPYQSEEFDMPDASAVASAMSSASINVGDVNFVGWSTTDFPYQTTEPTLAGASVSVTEETNYYAVFTNVEKIRLDKTSTGVITSYPANDAADAEITIDGKKFKKNHLIYQNESGGVNPFLQFKSNNTIYGRIYNTDALTNIIRAEVAYKNTDSDVKIYACSAAGTTIGNALTAETRQSTDPYVYLFPDNTQYLMVRGDNTKAYKTYYIDIYYASEAVYYTTQFSTLTFKKANGTTDKDEMVAKNKAYALTEDDAPAEVEHYTFLGKWLVNDAVVAVGESVTADADKTLIPITEKEISSETPATENISDLPAGVVNVVVAADQELKVNAGKTLDNLTVQAGGEVSGTANLTVNNLTINSEAGASGQYTGTGAVTINGDLVLEIKLDDELDASKYYCISAPFAVSAFEWGNGNTMEFNVDYQLFKYDGDKRARTGNGWQRVGATMEANTAYFIIFNNDPLKYKENTIRLKAANKTIPTTTELALATHTQGDNDADKNWNGLGNPRLHYVNLNKTVSVFESSLQGFNPYPWSEHTLDGANGFVVGTAFFVKDQNESAMTFANTHYGEYRAPRREGATNYTYCVEIAKENANRYDNRLYVMASETASTSFEEGKDLPTLNSETSNYGALIWTSNYGMRLAVEEAPLVNQKASYDLGIFAPAAGTYTISVAAPKENAELYLTKNGRIYWNLTMGACELDLAQGQNNEYGLVLRAEAPQVTTGVENGELLNGANGVQKVIIDEHVYILRGGEMYDMTGKAVK